MHWCVGGWTPERLATVEYQRQRLFFYRMHIRAYLADYSEYSKDLKRYVPLCG